MKPRVLIVDDEEAVRSSLRMIFDYEGYEVFLAANGPAGLKMAEQESPDLVILDIKMPQMDGLEVLKRLKAEERSPPVVILSGHGTVKAAVEAVKLGAFDFIEKPPESDRILIVARNALGQKRLVEENRRLKLSFDDKYRMVGQSPALEKVWDSIRRAAPTGATVLLTGESGVGKELAARAIHRNSLRQDEPFIQVNCAAIPEELIESELFGHEKGSFTGATEKQIGQVRAGPPGHHLPRRDRRHEPADPGQGAPRPPGGRGRAPRLAEDDPGGRPGHRRHQPDAGGGDRGWALPRGPLLPPLGAADPGAPAAGAARGRGAPDRPLRPGVLRRQQLPPQHLQPPRRWRPCASTAGGATCGS